MTSEHVNGNPIQTPSESHGLTDSGGTEYQWQSEQEPSRPGSGVISTGRVRLPVMHGGQGHLGVASLTTKRSRRGEVDYRGSTAGKRNAAECPVIRSRSLQSRHNCRSMASESEDVRQLTRQRASLGALVWVVDSVRAEMYLQPKSRWRRLVARSRGRVT